MEHGVILFSQVQSVRHLSFSIYTRLSKPDYCYFFDHKRQILQKGAGSGNSSKSHLSSVCRSLCVNCYATSLSNLFSQNNMWHILSFQYLMRFTMLRKRHLLYQSRRITIKQWIQLLLSFGQSILSTAHIHAFITGQEKPHQIVLSELHQ